MILTLKLEWDWNLDLDYTFWNEGAGGGFAFFHAYSFHAKRGHGFLYKRKKLTKRNEIYICSDPHGFVTFHAKRGSHIFPCLRGETRSTHCSFYAKRERECIFLTLCI